MTGRSIRLGVSVDESLQRKRARVDGWDVVTKTIWTGQAFTKRRMEWAYMSCANQYWMRPPHMANDAARTW
jgi:hypothetical protein